MDRFNPPPERGKHRAMLRLGLTGGIACGKSVVGAILKETGFAVLDADSLAHKLIEPGQPAYEEIAREFGSDILDSDGHINRGKLAAVVFSDRAKLERLNAITHPRVERAIARQFEEWASDTGRTAAFVEAALLIEAGYREKLDGLVVAWCTPEQQLERLRSRGFSEEDALARIASQLSAAEKLRHATHTIDCSGTLEDTRRQVEALAATIAKSEK
jgi:dephospho-CoA kinase